MTEEKPMDKAIKLINMRTRLRSLVVADGDPKTDQDYMDIIKRMNFDQALRMIRLLHFNYPQAESYLSESVSLSMQSNLPLTEIARIEEEGIGHINRMTLLKCVKFYYVSLKEREAQTNSNNAMMSGFLRGIGRVIDTATQRATTNTQAPKQSTSYVEEIPDETRPLAICQTKPT
jgi:hypothetical protein